MKRTALVSTALLAAAAIGTLGNPTPAQAHHDRGRPSSYLLTGDPVDAANPAGSKFEGIGADERRGLFYVSEVTGGEIHRGSVGRAQTREWLAGDGTDGRYTARGITVDRAGNVYVAGGPNGIGTGRPDLWVYDRKGTLLAPSAHPVPTSSSTTSPSARTARPTSPTPTTPRSSGSPRAARAGR